jgi:hypothetical protein
MGMAIIFAWISGVVFPIAFWRNGGIPKTLCVSPDSRFVFDNHDRRSRVFDE